MADTVKYTKITPQYWMEYYPCSTFPRITSETTQMHLRFGELTAYRKPVARRAIPPFIRLEICYITPGDLLSTLESSFP